MIHLQGRCREELRRLRGQLLGVHELRLQGVQLRPAGVRGDDVRQPDRRLRVQARLRRGQVQRVPGRHARRGRRVRQQRREEGEKRPHDEVRL